MQVQNHYNIINIHLRMVYINANTALNELSISHGVLFHYILHQFPVNTRLYGKRDTECILLLWVTACYTTTMLISQVCILYANIILTLCAHLLPAALCYINIMSACTMSVSSQLVIASRPHYAATYYIGILLTSAYIHILLITSCSTTRYGNVS